MGIKNYWAGHDLGCFIFFLHPCHEKKTFLSGIGDAILRNATL